MKIRVVVMMMTSLLSLASTATAQDGSGWYARVGAGKLNADADFYAYYTYHQGGTRPVPQRS